MNIWKKRKIQRKIAYGVREDNRRELLCLSQNPTESAEFWGELLRAIKGRGAQEIDLFVADGIKGLEDKFLEIYPNGEFQKCDVHKQRNVLKRIRPSDKKEVAQDLKEVFNNFDKDATIEKALKHDKFDKKSKQASQKNNKK